LDTKKWSVRYYNKLYNNGQNKNKSASTPTKPFPPLIGYSTSLATCEDIYPNVIEKAQVCSLSLRFFWDMFILFLATISFCFKLGLSFENPLKQIHGWIPNTKMVLTFVSPDIVTLKVSTIDA